MDSKFLYLLHLLFLERKEARVVLLTYPNHHHYSYGNDVGQFVYPNEAIFQDALLLTLLLLLASRLFIFTFFLMGFLHNINGSFTLTSTIERLKEKRKFYERLLKANEGGNIYKKDGYHGNNCFLINDSPI